MIKNLTKYNKTTLCSALFATCIAFPTDVKARGQEQVAPLHIKINSSQKNAEKRHFNIQTGKSPLKKINETIVKPATKVPAKTIKSIQQEKEKKLALPLVRSKRSTVQKVIETIPCHVISAENSNRYKILADSLRLYVKANKRDSSIINAIYNVSAEEKVDFELLVIKAMIESDLGRVTTSSKSSARGIFQYIEPTWLILMKRYGLRIGYKDYADSIYINTDTRLPEVREGSQFLKSDILALRQNTKIATLIKALQIKDEAKVIKNFKNGGRVNTTDHYIVHMLGLSLAREFYELRSNKSDIILANSTNRRFNEAVRLNPYFFFDAQNNPLTASQAYKQFQQKIAQEYKELHAINAKYGVENMSNGRCHSPKIITAAVQTKNLATRPQRVTAPSSTNIKTRADISSLAALAKTYKVKVTKNQP